LIEKLKKDKDKILILRKAAIDKLKIVLPPPREPPKPKLNKIKLYSKKGLDDNIYD
jgi:hypothetical protein